MRRLSRRFLRLFANEFLLTIAVAGWFSGRQQTVINHLMEENPALKEQPEAQPLCVLGVGNRLLELLAKAGSADDPIRCRERLGALLDFNCLEAA